MTTATVPPFRDLMTRIIKSDVGHILQLLPSYKIFQVYYDAKDIDTQPALCVGECGDSEVWVFPNGVVTRLVIRDTVIRKKGQTLDVLKPMGEYFKAVDPFAWAHTLQAGIMMPMAPPVLAFVLMFIHKWADKRSNIAVELPLPAYEDLHRALVLMQKAFELEMALPSGQRKIPTNIYKQYVEMTAKASTASSTAVPESKEPETPQREGQDPTSAAPTPSLQTTPRNDRVLPPEDRASADALMARLYGRNTQGGGN